MSLRTNAHKMQISKTVRTTVVTYSLAMLGLWGCMGIAIADSLPQTFQPSNIPAITKAAQRAVENSGDKYSCATWYINAGNNGKVCVGPANESQGSNGGRPYYHATFSSTQLNKNSVVKGYVASFPKNCRFGVQIQNPNNIQTFATFSYAKCENPFAVVHRQ